jgi:hypothetical protein
MKIRWKKNGVDADIPDSTISAGDPRFAAGGPETIGKGTG